MNCSHAIRTAALLLVTSGAAGAQTPPQTADALRASASGRATSQVTLAHPAPAAGVRAMGSSGAMAGMAPSSAAPAPLVIRLDYGQPHLRGRVLHTDSLVPFDKPWRLGANQSTTLTTDVDLLLGGASLAKGTYVLYALPGKTAWKLIVQRSAKQTPMDYKDANDIARVDLRYTSLPVPLESLTMWLIPSATPGPPRGELRFAWGSDMLSADWSIR
ncbi:MAG: hypothetical protein NVS9B3_02960 [Gemmatimonadaceae bacterium]